ncbi:hypothetical protein bthur0012_17270 [Bacillus thuringiensis serovar pulsiensis BGSC 4CC1]|nr:hypothetical protein bthur0012_17270 [Bacillus thuringiensis serovar pulsiensis BGSC 4CC1]
MLSIFSYKARQRWGINKKRAQKSWIYIQLFFIKLKNKK